MSHDVKGSPGDYRKLVLGALGVVYGDIGTSPLYALSECFHATGLEPDRDSVLGVLSLIVWTLIVIVTVKYLVFVMRADNDGEGGIMALMALVRPKTRLIYGTPGWMLVVFGLFGAALLYGDGAITPAISVLSAVEGLKFVTHAFEPYVIPITLSIIVGLFYVQYRGAANIGAVFGPIMVAWFGMMLILGVMSIFTRPEVLLALWPGYGISFLLDHGFASLAVLGGVFLVTTGGEALYADMGHFGAGPIRVAWFGFVLPSLLCQYFGQGALLLNDPHAHPFFGLAPSWALIPVVMLATAATVIASQALISGAFSLTRQAIQLGYLPRVRVQHTSAEEIGQIYIAPINWALLCSTIGLVLAFKSATALASAYGIAVVITMTLTTILFGVHARRNWGWSLPAVLIPCIGVGVVELIFVAANAHKIVHGGWLPLAAGATIFILMMTWYDGRLLLADHLRDKSIEFNVLQRLIDEDAPYRVPRMAVYMTGDSERVPPALFRNLVHNKVLHERVLLVTVDHEDVPHVAPDDRLRVEVMSHGFWKVTLRFGFIDVPDVPRALLRLKNHDIPWDLEDATFFLGRETVLPTDMPGMMLWREYVFAFLANNAERATAYYRLPPALVVEFGTQIEI